MRCQLRHCQAWALEAGQACQLRQRPKAEPEAAWACLAVCSS